MMKRAVIWVVVFALALLSLAVFAIPAQGQTVRGDRFTFNTGPCVLRSGSGSPEGVVTGNVCDQWHRTDAPYLVYIKRSGSGNTGWLLLASTDLTDTANLARLNAATNAFTSALTIGTTLGVTGAASLDGGITVDTTNFTVSGTTGAIATTALAALTTPAESWVGPSTTAGVYFKSGNVGFGIAAPTDLIHLNHATRPGVRFHLAGVFRGYFGIDNNFYYSAGASGDFIVASGGNIRFGSSSGTGEKLVIDNTNSRVGIGDTTPDATLEVAGGDIGISTQGNGLILKATNGANCFRVTVDNAGVLSTASVTCP